MIANAFDIISFVPKEPLKIELAISGLFDIQSVLLKTVVFLVPPEIRKNAVMIKRGDTNIRRKNILENTNFR